jgi:hypothetical protein
LKIKIFELKTLIEYIPHTCNLNHDDILLQEKNSVAWDLLNKSITFVKVGEQIKIK